MGHVSADETRTLDRQSLKFGGVLAVIGGLGYFVTLLLHGDLPDQTTEIALEHIAGRPEWRALMACMGLRPSRTHTFETADCLVHIAPYLYVCACPRRYRLTPRRHERAQAAALHGGEGYCCKICRATVRWVRSGT